MAKRGMPKIPICKNWLIYWGICRKFPRQKIADMAFVSRPTVDERFRGMGLKYRACRTLKSRKRSKKNRPLTVYETPPTSKTPPWEKNSHVSNFLTRLAEDSRGKQSVDVREYMRQYREGVRNGRL